VRMGRPYGVSPGILLVGVRPPVDTGKRRLFHEKVTTGDIPRAFGNVWRRGMRAGGSGEHEGPREPVLYFGTHLHTLVRIIGKPDNLCEACQVPSQ
jgi:hypothetical protein